MSTGDDVEAFDLLERASGEVRALADRMETIGGQFEARPSNPWRGKIPSLVSTYRLADDERASFCGADGKDPLGRSQTIASIWASRDHLYAISNCLVDRTVFSLMSLSPNSHGGGLHRCVAQRRRGGLQRDSVAKHRSRARAPPRASQPEQDRTQQHYGIVG